MRALLNITGEEPRFSISETGIGVEWSQLNRTTDLQNVTYLTDRVSIVLYSSVIDQQQDVIQYDLMYSPFRIIQYINDKVSVVVNDMD